MMCNQPHLPDKCRVFTKSSGKLEGILTLVPFKEDKTYYFILINGLSNYHSYVTMIPAPGSVFAAPDPLLGS